MEGFVYKWINKINKKWYIGSHRGHPEDGYTAGGKLIKEAFRKHGIENFEREIISITDHYRELEEFILTELDAMNNPASYNLKNDSIGGGTHLQGIPKTREHIQAMVQAENSGRFKKGQEPCNKGSNPQLLATRERRLRKEFITMEERVKKANKTKKERGYTNGKLGTTRTEESKRKTAEAVKRSWEKRKQQKPN